MKRILFFVFLLLASYAIQPAPPYAPAQVRREFNIQSFGAKADNATSATADIRKAVAALNANASNGGGTLVIPSGKYLIDLGNPASDPNITNIVTGPPTVKAVFNITANNSAVVFAPDVTFRVRTSHLYQSTTGQAGQTGVTYLFYLSSAGIGLAGGADVQNFVFNGNNAQFNFELNGPTLVTGNDDSNAFGFIAGNTRKAIITSFNADAFPQAGQLAGYTSGGEGLTDTIIEKVRFTNRGGGSDDTGFFVWGSITFRDCYFNTDGRASSHHLYFNVDKPRVNVDRCYFGGVDNITSPVTNKFAIQVYGASGTDIREINITNSWFVDNLQPIMVWKDDSVTYSRKINITGNYFKGRWSSSKSCTAVSGHRLKDSNISGNYFDDWEYGVRPINNSQSLNIHGNVFENSKFNIQVDGSSTDGVSIIGNTIRTPVASGRGICPTGSNAVVVGNQINVSNVASFIGLDLSQDSSPVDWSVQANTITGVGASGVKGISISRSSTRLKLIGNQVNLTTTGISVEVSNNCTDCRMVDNSFVSAGSGDAGAFNMSTATSTWKLIGNTITGGNIYLNASTTEIDNNTVTGTLSGTNGARRATRNTFGGNFEFVTSGLASYTPNAGLHREHRVSPATNLTVNAPTQVSDGDILTFKLAQPVAGGLTVTWNAVFALPASGVTWDTGASKISRYVFRYDAAATKWFLVSATLGM